MEMSQSMRVNVYPSLPIGVEVKEVPTHGKLAYFIIGTFFYFRQG